MDSSKRLRYKWITYGIVFFVTVLLQTTLLSPIRFWNATASLLPILVAMIAMREGAVGGAGAGLIAGILADALAAPTTGFYTIVLVLCGILVGLMCRVLFRRGFLVALLYWAGCVVFTDLVYFFIHFLLAGQSGGSMFWLRIPGELAASIWFTPPLYWIVSVISRHFEAEEESIL